MIDNRIWIFPWTPPAPLQSQLLTRLITLTDAFQVCLYSGDARQGNSRRWGNVTGLYSSEEDQLLVFKLYFLQVQYHTFPTIEDSIFRQDPNSKGGADDKCCCWLITSSIPGCPVFKFAAQDSQAALGIIQANQSMPVCGHQPPSQEVTEPAVVFQAGVAGVGVSPSLVLKVTDTEKDRLRRMQGVAGNIGLINPLVFNHFGYGTYAQVQFLVTDSL